MFRSLKSISAMLGRDFGKIHAKAEPLRQSQGAEAARNLLREELQGVEDTEDLRLKTGYVECRILLAECEAECALNARQGEATLAGVQALLALAGQYAAYFQSHHDRLAGLLRRVEEFVRQALAPEWKGGGDRRAFALELARVAAHWNTLQQPAEAARLGEFGLGLLPAEPRLLVVLIEAAAARGDLTGCLQRMESFLDTCPVPAEPGALLKLLEPGLASGDRALAGRAHALAGEIYRRLQRPDQSLEALTEAHELLGESLPEFAIEALMLTWMQRRKFELLEKWGRPWFEHGLTPARCEGVARALHKLLGEAPDRRRLWIVWAVASLRLGRMAEAVEGFRRALALDRSLAAEVVSALPAAGPTATVPPALCCNLAQAFLAIGQFQQSLAWLGRVERETAISASEFDTAVSLAADLVQRQPKHAAARLLQVGLLLRRKDLIGAVESGRQLLQQAADSQGALDVVRRVREAAAAAREPAAAVAALQLEIEAHLHDGDQPSALSGLEALARHESATPELLAWAGTQLRRFTEQAPLAQRARLALGELLQRANQARPAAEEYLQVLASKPVAELLERACVGLARVLSAAPDRDTARAELARGWLTLERPAEARGPLLECLAARQPQGAVLLDLLRAQQARHPASEEWVRLGIDAALASGVESNLAAAAKSLGQFLESRPERAPWAADAARPLLLRASADETRTVAARVQARACILAGDHAQLEELCRNFARQGAQWRLGPAEVLGEAATTAEPKVAARLALLQGQLLAAGTGHELQAAACFDRAAQLEPSVHGETALAEAGALAGRSGADPALALSVAKIARRLGRGDSACGELLRVLNAIGAGQLAGVRELAASVIAEKPGSDHARLLLARCEARLGNPAVAGAAYRQLIEAPDTPLLDLALADLRALHEANPDDFDLFASWLDARTLRGDAAAVRTALLARMRAQPREAGACLQRLQRLAQRPGHTGEDVLGYAEALQLAGRPKDAVAVWTDSLGVEGMDWAKCAPLLRELSAALPDDFAAWVALLRAEIRSLPPERLTEPLIRMEMALSLPGHTPALLGCLLEDCAQAEQRAMGRGEVARLAAMRRAEVLVFQGQSAPAAAALERWSQQWPADTRQIVAFCQRQLDAGETPVFLRPLARARFMAGEVGAGVAALRELAERMPDQLPQARALAQEFVRRAEAESWEHLQLLLADLAVKGADYRTAAESYLSLVATAPHRAPEVRIRLAALADQDTDTPEIHTALAELDLHDRPENLAAAGGILRRYLERDVPGHFTAVTERLRSFETRFPRALEARLQLLRALFVKSPPPVAEIEAEAQGMFTDFGADGARAFLQLSAGLLAERKEHVPFWHLKCSAHELAGDLSGSLACLRVLMAVDLAGQAAAVERRALAHRRNGVLPAPVLELLADLALQRGDASHSAGYLAEAVELPEAGITQSRAALERLLADEPGNVTARCALARCDWKEGNGAAAAAQYRAAAQQPAAPPLAARLRELCEAFPETARCWFVRGECACREGDFEDAFHALERASELPGLDPVEQLLAWKMLADCHARAHRFEEAAALTRRILAANPADEQAARRLMELYFERNAHELARTRDEIARGGGTPELIFRLGQLLRGRGDYEEAARCFVRLPRAHPLANTAMIESGQCRLALNQGHLATAAFKAALGNSPQPDERRAALYHLGLTHARRLDFQAAAQTFEELCMDDPGYEDAARQLQHCQEQLAAGDRMRLAEVPFDLLTAWRDLAVQAASGPMPPPRN